MLTLSFGDFLLIFSLLTVFFFVSFGSAALIFPFIWEILASPKEEEKKTKKNRIKKSKAPKSSEIIVQTPVKEEAVEKLDFSNIASLREYVESDEGQEEINIHNNVIRKRFEGSDKWVEACRETSGLSPMDIDMLEQIHFALEPFIEETPPGHDPGHIRRDIISSFALTSDPFVQKAFYPNELDIAILGGAYHDVGNAITHRYNDSVLKAAHAEVTGWIIYQKLKNILGETRAGMLNYCISAHTHYTKPVIIRKGDEVIFIRTPYEYGLTFVNGQPIGLAPILTRFADRLDNNGVTVFARHLLANADAVESGRGGQDYTGKEFFDLNRDMLRVTVLPEVRSDLTPAERKPPTALEHILLTFARSNFGMGIYSRDDHLFETMSFELMFTKVREAKDLVKIVTGNTIDFPSGGEYVLRKGTESLIQNTLSQISSSKYFDRSWNVLSSAFDFLTDEQMARWQRGFVYIQKAYADWVQMQYDFAKRSKHPAKDERFLRDMVSAVL